MRHEYDIRFFFLDSFSFNIIWSHWIRAGLMSDFWSKVFIYSITMQITCSNETFTQSDYNGFSILIRDSDGYINGTKMVKDINTKTGKNKRLRKILENIKF